MFTIQTFLLRDFCGLCARWLFYEVPDLGYGFLACNLLPVLMLDWPLFPPAQTTAVFCICSHPHNRRSQALLWSSCTKPSLWGDSAVPCTVRSACMSSREGSGAERWQPCAFQFPMSESTFSGSLCWYCAEAAAAGLSCEDSLVFLSLLICWVSIETRVFFFLSLLHFLPHTVF